MYVRGASNTRAVALNTANVKNRISIIARAVYGEAEGQSLEEKRWVAWTIRNRVEDRKHFPQFSNPRSFGTAVKKDYKGYSRSINRNSKAWAESLQAAHEAHFAPRSKDPTHNSTFFYARRRANPKGITEKEANSSNINKRFGTNAKLLRTDKNKNFAHFFFRIFGR
ncbi:MAG: hypothetical protein DRP50_00995 [Thermotoga sp.]|nr:MAG: hypothetical protein DRP50_00995 [Thermotoga sp.]